MASRRTRQACVFCLNSTTSKYAVKKKRGSKRGGGSGVCVNNKESCELLENEVNVVFVVRKLLSIPSDECKKLLETFGNPSGWLDICETCTSVVNEAREAYRKICALEKELEGCREKVKKKIVLSDGNTSSTESNLQSGRKSKSRKVMVEEVNEATVRIRTFMLLDNDASVTTTTSDKTDSAVKEEVQEFETEDYESVDYYQDSADVLDFGTEMEEDVVEINAGDGRISEKTDNCDEDDSLQISKKGSFASYKGIVYKCSYCSAGFKAEAKLAVHLAKVHSAYGKGHNRLGLKYPTRWKCRHCKIKLQTLEEFKKHCIEKHGMRSCDKCPRLLSSHRSLRRHQMTLHNSILPKKIGGTLTKKKSNDNDNDKNLPPVKSVVFKDMEVYQCKNCNYCNKNKREVIRHMYEMHCSLYVKDDAASRHLKCDKCPPREENVSESNFSTLDDLNNHKIAAHGMFKCNECEGIFLTIGYLENHQLMFHSAEKADPSCWIRNNNVVSTQLLDKGNKKLIQCKFCQESFNTYEKLTRHNLDEHTSEMFKCDKCSEVFDRLHRLFSHKTKVHKESNNPYKCSQCDFTNRHYKSIHLHYMNIHEKRTRVVCELCSATFAKEQYLVYHKVQKHGQGDPGNVNTHCNQCNKTFSTPAYLSRHINTVHLGQWRYKCPHCDNGFVSQKQVDHHVNVVHKKVFPHGCTVEGCDKKFAVTWQLNQHIKQTHGPRIFKCPYCDYSATANSILRRHELKHTDIGPHTCDHCGKSYGQYKSLQQHLRLAHKIRFPQGRKAKLTPFVASITGEKNNINITTIDQIPLDPVSCSIANLENGTVKNESS